MKLNKKRYAQFIIILAVILFMAIGLIYYAHIVEQEAGIEVSDSSKGVLRKKITKADNPTKTQSEILEATTNQKLEITNNDNEPLASKKTIICAEDCGSSIVAGTDGLSYGVVIGPDCKCWLDRNLGATQVAISATDKNAYGYYYQWGRLSDGHQNENSATTSIASTRDIPGNGDFITPINENVDLHESKPIDWRVPQNSNLWQKDGGVIINNPCPLGWRVPTKPEWDEVASYFLPQNGEGAFDSVLKLPLNGLRDELTGSLVNQNSSGWYWTSSVSGGGSLYFVFSNSGFLGIPDNRADGLAVRCIKNW